MALQGLGAASAALGVACHTLAGMHAGGQVNFKIGIMFR